MKESMVERSGGVAMTFSKFVTELEPGQIAMGLFEALPEVLFWIKDDEGRFVYVNHAYSEILVDRPEDLVGKTDLDLFPAELARAYVSDDELVKRSGEAIYNKLELVIARAGGVEWRMTSKIPLLGKNGRIVGTAGISRRVGREDGELLGSPLGALSGLVGYIKDHLSAPLPVTELAERVGMSVSTLERRFRGHFGTSPKQFVMQLRMEEACSLLLSTPMRIGEIAEALGYEEQASFTRAFTALLHLSPRAYRQWYRADGAGARWGEVR